MSVTININGLTLCHRGSGGVTHNTLPDVCKTPDKGIPLPYENEAYSRDLAKGTTTVSVDGGHMAAKLGSIFAKSVFDEGGSMGGILSGTHNAEADFITHSFNVFFEGRPACRLTDKMWMNHRNTVNMAGLDQETLSYIASQIKHFVCECDEEVQPSSGDTCMSLGTKKHDCVDAKKEEDNKKRQAQGKKPVHGSEKGYQVDKNGNVVRGADGKPKIDDIGARRAQKAANVSRLKGVANKASATASSARKTLSATANKLASTRVGMGVGKVARGLSKGLTIASYLAEFVYTPPEDIAILEQAEAARAAQVAEVASTQAAANLAAAEAEGVRRMAGHKYPDGSILGKDGKIEQLSEYKFPCPKGTPTGGKNKAGVPSVSRGKSTGPYSKGQKKSYSKILGDLIQNGEASPNATLEKYTTLGCPGNWPVKNSKKNQHKYL
jgi:hypothetical protein